MRGIDYYELLGVPRDASSSEIRSAYRTLAKAMHPDTGGTAGTFRLLREAYETLTDPERRDDYDSGGRDGAEPDEPEEPAPPPAGERRRPARRASGSHHVPTLPPIAPGTIAWWDQVRDGGRVTLFPPVRPTQAVVLAMVGGWVLLVVLLVFAGPPVPVLAGALLVLAGAGAAVGRTGRRHLAARRTDRAFAAEFGTRVVFGKPGAEPDEAGERLTADLLSRYLTRIPGVRIFHGLAAEVGSVFADIDHAVLCGRRLVLIESKLWLPGDYRVDEAGGLWRNGHRFRGGAVRLPDQIAAYRALLPDLELRGVLLLYPSAPGGITVGDPRAEVPPMVPDQFVRDVGGWLAADPSTVDREAFRTLLRQVVVSPD
ncbi:MAG: DnaJ domain-containing protein [Actinophytocola sp.]|uniref:J domain-containing protein n=1 Tax=Actinophytocola sp. TaxID=1872138 RepID=UPI00132129BE|nr:DnaJ domain-containing protein [Actinophytocola sp.]MPZ84904.1 DnaJ domain-containing protein [Actinophytocola sp.]